MTFPVHSGIACLPVAVAGIFFVFLSGPSGLRTIFPFLLLCQPLCELLVKKRYMHILNNKKHTIVTTCNKNPGAKRFLIIVG